MKLINTIKKLFRKKEEEILITKFVVGDIVSVTIYSDKPKLWYKGAVVEINNKAPHTMYKVHFLNGAGNGLTYWFLESELTAIYDDVKWSLEDEREARINQILND